MSEKRPVWNLEQNEMQVDFVVKYGKGYIQQALKLENIWTAKYLNQRFESIILELKKTKDMIDKGEITIE